METAGEILAGGRVIRKFFERIAMNFFIKTDEKISAGVSGSNFFDLDCDCD